MAGEPTNTTGGGTISAEKLCALTGLSDRRHRQLAKAGYFPAPLRGEYQLTPTVQGMFRHYRDVNARRAEHLTDERFAMMAAERKLAESKLARELNEVLPVAVVEAVWQDALSRMKDAIMAATISEDERKQIIRTMQTIPLTEYVEAKNRPRPDDSAEES